MWSYSMDQRKGVSALIHRELMRPRRSMSLIWTDPLAFIVSRIVRLGC